MKKMLKPIMVLGLLSTFKFFIDMCFGIFLELMGINYRMLIMLESIILLFALKKYNNRINDVKIYLFKSLPEKDWLTNLHFYFFNFYKFIKNYKLLTLLLLLSNSNLFTILNNLYLKFADEINSFVPEFINSEQENKFDIFFDLILYIKDHQHLVNYLYCLYFIIIVFLYKNTIDFNNLKNNK
ncbi:hypothetical protein [Streptococcus taonis]|uniref:Uncharacterized protein n=1 Tax=Streptococcus taonis TaxID=3041623 RepID=A0ABT6PB94_9STRE|nr:hypothetical protein [Streptococcus sp. ST22-14]MDI1473137.1 hypothetical protein [Streptococcus sp. ST22-14]